MKPRSKPLRRSAPPRRSTKPIPRSALAPRSAPPRRIRPGTRRGQPTRQERDIIRLAVYERAGGRCELRKSERCIPGILPFEGITPWDHGHLVHLRSEGAGGKTDMRNCRWGCHICHLVDLHNPKPCPPKPKGIQ